jgi:hypothetical protein
MIKPFVGTLSLLGVLVLLFGLAGSSGAIWESGYWIEVVSSFPEQCSNPWEPDPDSEHAGVCAEYFTGGSESPYEPCCLRRWQLGSSDPNICPNLTPSRPEES